MKKGKSKEHKKLMRSALKLKRDIEKTRARINEYLKAIKDKK